MAKRGRPRKPPPPPLTEAELGEQKRRKIWDKELADPDSFFSKLVILGEAMIEEGIEPEELGPPNNGLRKLAALAHAAINQ